MKVVHVINDLRNGGGAERLLVDLCRSGAGQRSKIILLWGEDASALSEEDRKNIDLLVVRIGDFSSLISFVKWMFLSDIVHVHLFPSLYLVSLFPVKKVFTEHNTWNNRRKRKIFKPLERFVYRRYSRVVAISHAASKALKKWVGEDVVPIGVVYNGIDLSRFQGRCRSEVGSDIRIGMAASFSAQKNQGMLIRLLKELPCNYRLCFAGDGPTRRGMEDLSFSIGVRDRVEFLGVVSDMPSYYDSLDVYIQASNWEGFGISVVEAMASGLPVLCSDVEGMDEVVGDKRYLFSNDKLDDLKSKLLSILESDEKYQKASEYSISRANRFSVDKTREEYMKIYKEVIGYRK